MAIPAMLAVASGPILTLAGTAVTGRLGAEPPAACVTASSLFSAIRFSWLSLQFERRLPGLSTGFTLFMGWRLATDLMRFYSKRWLLSFPRMCWIKVFPVFSAIILVP